MESQAPVKRELPPVRGVRMGWTDENTSNGPNMGVEVNSKEDSTHEIEVDQLPELDSHALPEVSHEAEFSRENTDEYQVSDRPYSAGSSSQSSRSSKRTSISADLSAHIRQRVRQQAVRQIAQKRGSVQLAKRLLRTQTLQTLPNEENEEDQEVIDRQIDETLKLGEKYTKTSTGNALAPLHIQKEFFESDSLGMEKPSDASSHVVFGKPNPIKLTETEKFGQLLTSYGRKALSVSIEDPIAKLDNKFFASNPGRDYSVLAQRIGTPFFTSNGTLKGLEEFITNETMRLDLEDEEGDFLFVEYAKAQNWDEWEKQKGRHPTHYFQFDIDVNRLEFDHHWLFSKEDALAREVRNFHRELESCGEGALESMQDYLRLQQHREIHAMGEEEKRKISAEMETIEKNFQEAFSTYRKVAGLLENAWHNLAKHRETQSYSTTSLLLERIESQEADFGEFPDIFRPFIAHPRFLLKEVKEGKGKKAEKAELEQHSAIDKCRIQLLIYFNEILVCKTKPIGLTKDFVANFQEIYNLRVFEKPEIVTLVINERFGRFGWRELARIFVPVPTELEDQPWGATRLEPMHFASDLRIDKHKGSMGSGEPNSPFIQGHLFCTAMWIDSYFGQKTFDKEREAHKEDEKFELIPLETRLVSNEEFDSNIRFEALSKRFSRKYNHEKQPSKWVGLTNAEIDHGWLDDEFKMDERARTGLVELSSIDVYRKAGNHYAAMIRSHLMETFARDIKMKGYHDIVREEGLPTSLFDIGSIFGPPDLSRRLKPMRTITQKHQAHYRLVINLQSAINLPERSDNTNTHTFVEIVFQKQRVRSQVVDGKNANWQQTLVLDVVNNLDAHLDFKTVTDSLQLLFYDQIILPLEFDDREPNTIHEQIHKHFLGSIAIPFFTIFSLGKIDGALAIRPPLFLTGYSFPKEHSFLKVMITIDPPITPPKFSSYENFLAGEPDIIRKACTKWEKQCKAVFPERRFISLVNDANGKRVLATRFLRGIRPPRQILAISENREKAVDLATYLVSCIPFVADPVMFPGVLDLWTTVEQMITLSCGDEEEHAILLTCWLLYLGISAVLLLGTALPEGPKAAYVLVQLDGNSCWLINPTDGNKYELNEVMCPMISVGTLITSENIYGNIQRGAHPSQLDFDLKKTANWAPLFAEPRTDLASVQVESIEYTDVSEDALIDLRTNLEREIKLKFDEMRPYGIPTWNLLATRILREILSNLNNSMVFDIETTFSQLTSAYAVSAIAFRGPYTTKEKLLEDILNLSIHINSDQNAQFALAIFIQPFVNNIVSCFVAIASLTLRH